MKYISKIMKVFIGNLILLLLLGIGLKDALGDVRPTNSDIGPNTVELLIYQASGYRFQVIDPFATPPSEFEQPDFDDTAWDVGDAAFGTGGVCPLQTTVHTFWPVESQLLVRRIVSIPAGTTGVRIMVSIDNDIIGVFFNGTSLSNSIYHEGCPIMDEFRFDVPQYLVQPGQNVVVFNILDRGAESFFDTRVLGEVPDEITIDIDIKPGSFPNPINLKSKGNVPVAILSSPTFDATTVDRSTVLFADTSPLPIGESPEDVNGDGLPDVILHFSTQSLNLQLSDTEACLTGKTLGGQDFEGCDSVLIVK